MFITWLILDRPCQVEVLSHYGSEFFCPISLFRIYGLSEFEVIDTIEDPNEDNDEAEDTEILEEQDKKKTKGEDIIVFLTTLSKNISYGLEC